VRKKTTPQVFNVPFGMEAPVRYNRLAFTFCVILTLVILPVKQAAASASSENILTQTFLSIAEHDGWVLETSETSGQGGVFNAAGVIIRVGDNAQDRQYRSIVSFNTAGLPNNAVIVSATLKLKQQGGEGTNPFTTHNKLLVNIRKPFFGGLAALESGDFQAIAGLETAGVVSAVAADGYHSAKLVNAALAHINRAGLTQLRLRFLLEDNDDQNADYLSFYSGNVTNPALRPALEIKYYIPPSPTSTRTTNPCEPTVTPTRPCTDCAIPMSAMASCPTPVSTATQTVTPTHELTSTPTITPTGHLEILTPTVTPTILCRDC
jgi:hypothetical protein